MCCARCAVGALIFICCGTVSFCAVGQTNRWTGPVSEDWEDHHWSLGVLPGANQTIIFANPHSKTLTIGTNTSKNYPQTLTIGSLYISSPKTNTVNTLFLNDSGLQTPLEIAGFDNPNFILGANCHVLMLSSALSVAGDFSIGGTFDETENSLVLAPILNVGDLAPGVFNLTNSTLEVMQEYIGGTEFPGTVNQQGGTNVQPGGYMVLNNPGTYNLYDGYFNTLIVFMGGTFNQFGGNAPGGSLLFFGGSYTLAGGTFSLSGYLNLPDQPPPNSFTFGASFSQSGGTNTVEGISLGGAGVGEYSLSGGTLSASILEVGDATADLLLGSTFSQSGGYHTNGSVGIFGSVFQDLAVVPSEYDLSGGILSTPSIGVDLGNFYQSGGTNEAGGILLSQSFYSLSGGWLFAKSIQHSGGDPFFGQIGSIQQSGGTNQVGRLSLSGGCFYTLSGGRLTAGQIQIDNATFNQSLGSSAPGSLDGMNLLTLADAIWNEQAGGQQSFGQLQLSGDSNSLLTLPNVSCAMNFANSSTLVWSNAVALSISNWNGSLYGGGAQQVTFGESTAALTAQQVHQLQFQNPAGLPAGTYPGRILATGEIVPDTGAPLPLKLTNPGLLSNGAFQLSVEGNIGESYYIEASTNLLNWVLWTTVTDLSGTISVTDSNTSNFPQRFYRAQQVP